MNVQSVYLVAPVAAKRAVRINTAVCIALFEASSIVAIYMNVPTTAMKESQKSKNWTQIQYNRIEEMCIIRKSSKWDFDTINRIGKTNVFGQP